MIVGSIWYGPLFGKIWIKLSDVSHEQLESVKKKGDVGAGLSVGFWNWLGFVAPGDLAINFFSSIIRP